MIDLSGCQNANRGPYEIWEFSIADHSIKRIVEANNCNRLIAFNPEGKKIAYEDILCVPRLISTDGSGVAIKLDKFPIWWTSSVYPQWGGEAKIPAVPTQTTIQPIVPAVVVATPTPALRTTGINLSWKNNCTPDPTPAGKIVIISRVGWPYRE